MKKKLLILAIFLGLASTLLMIEYTSNRKLSVGELSASIIRETNLQNEAKTPKPFTVESLGSLLQGTITVKEDMTTDFLDALSLPTLPARKKVFQTDTISFTVYEIDKIKNYPVILTESYVTQGSGLEVYELSKSSFLIEKNDGQIRFVTQGKDTIIGLLFSKEFEGEMKNVIGSLGYESL